MTDIKPDLDPYRASRAVERLIRERDQGAPLRVACLDIDSTLTGDGALADGVRQALDARGFVVGFNTSRTEEMVMTSETFTRTSLQPAFDRPPPKLGWEGKQENREERRRVYVPPETVEPRGILDGDFVAGSSGTRLLVRQQDGQYRVDTAYEGRYGLAADEWRAGTLQMLRELFTEGVPGALADIEDPQAYEAGLADIYPPHFRIQVNFSRLEEKLWFELALHARRHARSPSAAWARHLWMTDDSHPRQHHWKLFLTPRGGSKAHAAEWLVTRLCHAVEITREQLEMVYIGDSFPDLDMGLLGGLNTHATLLLAGQSRLVEALTSPEIYTFAGQSLTAYRRRLQPIPSDWLPASEPGRYQFRAPRACGGSRTLLIGDVLFPGTRAVETAYQYVSTL